MSTTESRRTGFSPFYLVIGVVVAVAAVGWAYVVANVGQTPGIVAQTISFTFDRDTVRLRYEVSKSAGREVRCVVRATDIDHVEVARTEIVVSRGTSHVVGDEVLKLPRKATSADIRDCRSR